MTPTDSAVDELCRIDGCTTLSALFRKRVREHPDEVALREKDLGIWNEYTWQDFGDEARQVCIINETAITMFIVRCVPEARSS